MHSERSYCFMLQQNIIAPASVFFCNNVELLPFFTSAIFALTVGASAALNMLLLL